MKKLQTLLICLAICATPSFAQNFQSQPANTITRGANYTSFSKPVQNKTSEAVIANSGHEADPELGVLFAHAPGNGYYELLGERTETSKRYVKAGTNGKEISIISSNIPMHYRDENGNWRTIVSSLQPDVNNSGVFANEGHPVKISIDAKTGFSRITRATGEQIEYNRNLELVYISPSGEEHSMDRASWAKYTAGDDGVKVIDAWPGIDIVMTVQQTGIKTSFSINRPLPEFGQGKLILRDHMNLSTGLSFSANTNDTTTGDIIIRDKAGNAIFEIAQAVAYEQHDARNSLKTLSCSTGDNNTFDINVPGSLLNKQMAYYPLVIDPLVTSNSVTGPNFSYYPSFCTATNNLTLPSFTTITDIGVTYQFVGNYPAATVLDNGGYILQLGTCQSPPTSGYVWACLGGYSTLTYSCGWATNHSIYSDVSACVPAPVCGSSTLSVTLGCTQNLGTAGGSCSNHYYYSYAPFYVEVDGTSGMPGITGSSSVCSGSTITLSDAASGGSWSSSASGTASVSSSGVVTGVTAGTATITYTIGSCYVTKVITVNSSPSISGSTTVCIGSSTTLTASPTGGTWSSSNTSIATVGSSSGVVTGISAGSFIITCTMASGCYGTYAMTANPTPASITGTFSVCSGYTTALSDASSGGSWSSSITSIATVGSSGVVTGVASGVDTIKYSFSTGCSAQVPITVSATPATITGIFAICTGSSTTLSDITSGGTWTSTTTGVATIGSSSGVVSGISPGTSIVSYTMPSGCFTTTTISVNANPAAISGYTSICAGGSVTLTDATSGGTWTSSNTSVATVGSITGIVTGVAGGSATITYTLITGCYATFTINVSPLPTAYTLYLGSSGVIVGCPGSHIILSSSNIGVSYQLFNGGSMVGSPIMGTGGLLDFGLFSTPGTYSVMATNLTTGCVNTMAPIVTILSNPAPITGATFVCLGQATTESDATSGGTWSSSNTSIASIGSISGVLTGAAIGTATITYTNSTGCYTTASVTVGGTPSISGTPSVCAGGSTVLSTSCPGAAWSSSLPAVATVGSSSGIVTGLSVGSATITCGCAGCFSSVMVTVNPLPAYITGIMTVCQGNTTALTDIVTGGTWTSGATSIATIGSSSGIVTGISGGVAPVTYTLGTGCSTSTIVTVNPSPATFSVTGGGSFCAGSTGLHIGLAGSQAGVQYSLLLGGTTVAGPVAGTGTAIDFGIFTAAGIYTVTATNPATMCTAAMTGSATIVINPLPTAFTVTGGGHYCAGGAGVAIGLSSSSAGIHYSLSLAGATVATVTGTGGPVSFGLFTAAGVYTAAGADLVTGCTNNMTGIATVTIDPLPSVIVGPSALCAGTTIALTDSTPGGSWTSSTPAVATVGLLSGTVLGVTNGVTTITYTLSSSGCYSTRSITVSITPGPIIGPSTVCQGAGTTLSDAVPGGTWYSGAPSIATIGSLSGSVLGVASGTTIITYTLGTGCTVYKTISVNPAPAAITGSTSICVGTSTTLSDASPGGTWNSGAPGVAPIGAGSGVVTGISAGIAIITYTLPTTCAITTAITVNTAPTIIGGPNHVCVNSSITLTNGASGGSWSSMSTGIASINSLGILTGLSVGTSVISYSLGSGCAVATTITVNPLPAPISGASAICSGLSSLYTDATSGGIWSAGPIGIASIGATTGIATGLSTGLATITYTISATGCFSTTTVNITTAPGAITGAGNVCVGQTLPLANPVGGGTWTSANPLTATVGSASGIVTGRAGGVTTITYLLGGCNATTTVTVVPLPGPITGTGTCVGQTSAMYDPTPGGVWSSSIPAVATIGSSSGLMLGVSSGTTIISYTMSSGCTQVTAEVVNPISPIIGASTVCVGFNATLLDTTLGGHWSSSATSIATVGSLSGMVTGVSIGSATISYVLPTGCIATSTLSVDAAPAPITGTASLCIGQNVTLSNASPGGTWSNGTPSVTSVSGSGSTCIVTGLAAGISAITYTPPSGCPAVKTVTVHPLPAGIAGPSVICMGSTATLSDATPGGTWSSSTTSVAAIGSASGILTPASTGVTTITYNITSLGCSVTKPVTVTPVTASITGTPVVCQGSTTPLSCVSAGGTWTSVNPAIATVDYYSGLVTGMVPGAVLITYSVSSGCSSSIVVTVNPLPAPISGPSNICAGATVALSDVTPGGSWMSTIPAVATITSSGVVTGIATGSTTISYTNGYGCAATLPMVVNPAPAPISGIPNVCLGLTSALSDATPGGTWSSSDIMIAPVSPLGVVTGVVLGTATISYTLGTGCFASINMVVNSVPGPIAGTPNVCVGDNTTLGDIIPYGYWSSTAPAIATVGSSSGVVSGISAGTSTVMYSTGAGCTTSVIVTVNPLPPAISGPGSVCTSQSISLTDPAAGGTWTSSAPGIASVGPSTGYVVGVTAGIATISYTAGCTTTHTVTVNQLPGSITGSANVCLGGTSTLHDSIAGGTWYCFSPAVAAIGPSSGIISGHSVGVATVVYQMPSGCFASKIIDVVPLPAVYHVTGGGNHCAGDTGVHIDLSGSSSGVNYMLYTGATAVGAFPGSGLPLDFGLQTIAGVYYVIATNSATGCSDTMAGSAGVGTIPSVTPVVNINMTPGDKVCAGTTVGYTTTASYSGSSPVYEWFVNGTPVSFGTAYSYIPADGDIVMVKLTSNYTCAIPSTVSHAGRMEVQPFAHPSVSLTASPNDTVCEGSAVTIYPSPAYGGPSPFYSWFRNAAPSGTGPSYTFVPNNGDQVYCIMSSNYACRLSNADTCAPLMITVDSPLYPQVTINAIPGFDISLGQTDTLIASVTNAQNPTYQWFINGLPITGATTNRFWSSNFSYPNEDSVSCMVTNHGVCSISSHQWLYIRVHDVAVQQLTAGGDLTIIPNPSNGSFTIKGSISSMDEEVSLDITDVLGQSIFKNKILASNGKLNERVTLGDVANGMYILTLNSASGNRVFHVVVER